MGERVTLKWILWKWGVIMKTGFIWVYWQGFIKVGKFLAAKLLLTFQEGLCSMELEWFLLHPVTVSETSFKDRHELLLCHEVFP